MVAVQLLRVACVSPLGSQIGRTRPRNGPTPPKVVRNRCAVHTHQVQCMAYDEERAHGMFRAMANTTWGLVRPAWGCAGPFCRTPDLVHGSRQGPGTTLTHPYPYPTAYRDRGFGPWPPIPHGAARWALFLPSYPVAVAGSAGLGTSRLGYICAEQRFPSGCRDSL